LKGIKNEGAGKKSVREGNEKEGSWTILFACRMRYPVARLQEG